MSRFRSSKLSKAITGFVGLATAVFMLGGVAVMPAPAHALTNAELQAQIDALLVRIAALQAQLGGGGSTTGGSCADKYAFTRSLHLNMSPKTGADVTALQDYLTGTGHFTFSGGSTGYFGPITQSAVAAWQAANNVNPPAGYFGPISQAKYNTICTPTSGGGGGTVIVPGTDQLAVSAGVSQPANDLMPANAARLPFTNFTVTAGSQAVTITKVEVERTGPADDDNFAGVILLDSNGVQHGLAKTFNSNHKALIGDDVVVPAGTSMTFTIAGNIASNSSSIMTNNAGQVATISVVNVQASSPVTGSFPITGAAHTANASLTIGSATLQTSSLTNPSTSEEIGETDYIFSGIRVTAGSAEDIRVKSIRWNQTGSAGNADLNGLVTEIDGVAYPTTVSSDGKFYTSTFGSGIVISKGLSKDITIKGDIIAGPARTAIFDIDKATDIHVEGVTLEYGITSSANSTDTAAAGTQQFTTGTPFYDGITLTINAGSFSSVSNSTTLGPADNIAINVPDTVLGAYQVNILGEPITVGSSVFHLGVASTAASITNITIFNESGLAIAGPQDVAASGVTTFSDSITYPTGISRYRLKGTISNSTGGWANGNTLSASTTPSTDWTNVTGDVTGNTISLSALSSVVTMSTQTVQPGALSVSVSSQPVAQTVIAGANSFEFARYILDANSSGEDIRITTLPVYFDTNGNRNDLGSCYLYDGTTAVSKVVNPAPGDTASSTTFTFTSPGLTVTKGTSKSLSAKCNIITGATAGNKYWWGLDTGQASSFTGVTGIVSNQTIAETLNEANGQVMTAAANGSYTVTSDSSILYSTAQANTSGVTLAAFRFEASVSEDVTLQKIALELGNVASNSPADLVGEQVSLWNGSTQVGTAQFNANANSPDHATSTLTSPVSITKGESVTITVKGDLSSHDAINGTPGAFLAVTYDGENTDGVNGNYAKGADSGANISSGTTSDVTTNGLRVFRTLPTVADVTTSTTLVAGADLYKIKVSAPSGRDVLLRAMTFDVTSSGIGFSSGMKLYGPGGAVNSTAAATTTDSGLSGDRLRITFDDTHNDRLIPAGSSKTFGLRLENLTGVNATDQESLTVKLVSDTAYPGLGGGNLMGRVASTSAFSYENAIEATASTTDRFVWSPNSTTTAESTAAKNANLDWTNGYGIPGFPSPGQDLSVRQFTD
tara:strand:+ start:1765 stop:5304 length:3540 start_codon:yes stop_codon:yes gene_type:complete